MATAHPPARGASRRTGGGTATAVERAATTIAAGWRRSRRCPPGPSTAAGRNAMRRGAGGGGGCRRRTPNRRAEALVSRPDAAASGRRRARWHDLERLHREVLRQPQPVDGLRRLAVPFLDPLPELALVDARERRAVLLALVLEDGADLDPQLFFGHGHEEIGLSDRPLLPRAAVEPHLRARRLHARERLVDRLLAHAVGAVRIGEIAGDQDQVGALGLEQLERDLHVARADRVLPHLAGLVEGEVQEPRLLA